MCDHNAKRPCQDLDGVQVKEPVDKKLKTDDEEKEEVLTLTCNDVNTANGGGSISKLDAKDRESTDDKILHKGVMSETDAGITEFLGDHNAFFGIIKQRFSDFLVSEIDPDGVLVKLDNLSLPTSDDSELSVSQHTEILSTETLDALKQLQDSESEPVLIEVEEKSKEERRCIHGAIKALFPKLCSNTQDVNGKKMIVVKAPSAKKDPSDLRQSWPKSRGNYTHFVLYKENKDTPEAISLIAKFLRMKPGVFTYAGVKDKRARTVQKASVYRVEAAKLLGLNKILRNMVIGNVTYQKEPLRLGDLSGNLFRIVLRNVSGTEDNISKAITSLAKRGFLNYFGMQRFGTTTVPTPSIGLAILKSQWEMVVDLIMKPRAGDDETMRKCHKMWTETKDADAVLQLMRRRNCIETHLLHGLKKHGPKDLVGALNAIPRNSRLMYVHSYQSSLWNPILSRRIQKYGLGTIKGDLILTEARAEGMTDYESNENCVSKCPTFLEADGHGSIYDVVLPLFGYDVLYPKNEIADWYREMLSSDGLDMDKIKHSIKDYSLSGSYRHIVIRPTNVEWSVVNYQDPTVSLLQSDWDVLQGKPVSSDAKDGPLCAVKLTFGLPRSCYATMALREVLHLDTSASFQRTLNA